MDKVRVVKFYNKLSTKGYMSNTFIVDISRNKWSNGPNLMLGRQEHACAVFNENRLASGRTLPLCSTNMQPVVGFVRLG